MGGKSAGLTPTPTLPRKGEGSCSKATPMQYLPSVRPWRGKIQVQPDLDPEYRRLMGKA
jgi:hypothetical protein